MKINCRESSWIKQPMDVWYILHYFIVILLFPVCWHKYIHKCYLDFHSWYTIFAACTFKSHIYTAVKQWSLTQLSKQNSYIKLSSKKNLMIWQPYTCSQWILVESNRGFQLYQYLQILLPAKLADCSDFFPSSLILQNYEHNLIYWRGLGRRLEFE